MRHLSLMSLALVIFVSGCNFFAGDDLDQIRQPQSAIVLEEHKSVALAAPAPLSETPKPHWPNWRGLKADGIAHGEEFSTEWPEEGLKQVWKAEIGIGFSSMAVAEGRLYAMGWSGGKETVFCLDALSGEKKWTHSYAGEKVDNLHDG